MESPDLGYFHCVQIKVQKDDVRPAPTGLGPATMEPLLPFPPSPSRRVFPAPIYPRNRETWSSLGCMVYLYHAGAVIQCWAPHVLTVEPGLSVPESL